MRKRRWSIFSLLILTYVLVYFHRMAPAVVSNDLMAAFGTTGAALGSLAAMYFYIYAAMQIPAGVLADTLGTRIAVTLGGLTAGIGSILFALAPSLGVASIGRLLVGLGVSVVFVCTMKSNSLWYRESEYGRISGLTVFIGNLGAVLSAGPLALALGWFSWRTVFVAIGGLSLCLALLSYLFVRNRPEDCGFASLRELDGLPPTAPREHHWLRELAGVMRIRAVWPGFLVNFGMTAGLYAFMGLWGIPYLRDSFGLERNAAAGYMTVMLFSFALGALFVGWSSDRLGRRKPVLVAAALLNTLCWALMTFTPWQPGPMGYLLFSATGFTGAGFMLTFACAKEVCKPMLAGMAVALVNMGTFVGVSIVQPLFGALLDRTWDGTVVDGIRIYAPGDYLAAMTLMVALAALGVGGTLLVTETRCRNIAEAGENARKGFDALGNRSLNSFQADEG